jgi:hypothetical protein
MKPGLKDLRRLSLLVSDDPGEYLITLSEVLYILQIASNIEVLHLGGCSTVPKTLRRIGAVVTLDDTLHLRNLTWLSLTDCPLSSEHFGNLMAISGPNLSKFSYQDSGTTTWYFDNLVTFEEVIEVLQPWTQSLRELTYRVFCDEPIDDLADSNLRRLKDFVHLDVLDVDVSALAVLGVWQNKHRFATWLPASLRVLRLPGPFYLPANFYLEGVFDAFKVGWLPRLSRVELEIQDFNCLYDPEDRVEPAGDTDEEEDGVSGGMHIHQVSSEDYAQEFRSAGLNVLTYPVGKVPLREQGGEDW